MTTAIRNFVFSHLATGVLNGATSLPLAPGTGVDFDDASAREYEVVVWNETDYESAELAMKAGEANSYRVTARSGDTLTVVQVEGSANLNTPGKSYRVDLAVTRFNVLGSGPANVLEFGVRNDGTLSTLELQKALEKTAGDPLLFPAGTYVTDERLEPPSGADLIGYGATLRQTDFTKNLLYVEGIEKLTLRGFELTHECPESEYHDQTGKEANIGQIIYDGGAGVGIGTSDVTLVDLVLRDCPIQAIAAWDKPKNWRVVRCKFIRIGKGGCIFVNGSGCIVADGYFDHTGDDAIAFNLDSHDCIAIGNQIYRAGAFFAQGACMKVHGQRIRLIGNHCKGGVQGLIRVQKADSGGGAAPADVLIANNILDRLYDEGEAEAAAVRCDEVAGLVRVLGNIINAGLYTVDDITGDEIEANNADIVRVENSPDLELEFERNHCRANHTGTIKFGMNFQANPKRLKSVGNTWDVGSALCRFAASGAKMRSVDWIDNIQERSTNQPQVQLVSGNNGAERIYFVGNRNRASTAPQMINLGNCPVDDFYEALLARGGASTDVSNAAGVTNRWRIQWTLV